MGDSVLKTIKAFAIKTEEEEINRFRRLKDDLGIATDSAMLTALLDRMELPQRVADKTKELDEKNNQLKQELDASMEKIKTLEEQLETSNRTANENAEIANRQQLEYNQKIGELTLKDNQAVISFTEDNLKVLDLVCNRETRRRKQNWTRSHVINYFINARFVRGLLNGDLDSISDADLRKIGVKNQRTKQDFDV